MEKRRKDNPWKLKTPPLSSEYEMYVDEKDGREILVCTVGKTVLHYDYRCLADLHAMLKAKRGQGRHGGALGPLAGQSHRRLVWLEEGPARPLRHVYPALDGGTGPGRSGTQRPQQPHAI